RTVAAGDERKNRSSTIFRALACVVAGTLFHATAGYADPLTKKTVPTATPIEYLVVIFQENNSFDHYFGTYPYATNPKGEPPFTAAADTPSVNGLNDALLNHNLNSVAPFRLDRSQAALDCDNSNAYAAEQAAADHG